MAMAMANLEAKDVALVPGRLALGSTMLYHGASKLKPGAAAQVAPWFEGLGMKPGKFWVRSTGLAELFAGVSALLGFGTRLAALAVLVTQGVAIAKVHRQKGFDNSKGGFEFNLMLMAIAAGLLASGPGRVSAHSIAEHRVRRKRLAKARSERWIKLLK